MSNGETAVAEQQNGQEQKVQIPEGHKEFVFHFRKEKIRDSEGQVIGEGKKHPEVKAVLPVPSTEDVINFIATGGKEAEMLMEVIYDAIKLAARGQINDYRESNPDATITPDVLDLSKLTFSAIAAMDKQSRGGVEIPEEVWASFYEDYKTVLVGLGKEVQRVDKHIVLFKSQFRTCKYDKAALGVLKDNLQLYAAKTENMEDNADCYEFLIAKLEKYLNAEEKNLVGAL